MLRAVTRSAVDPIVQKLSRALADIRAVSDDLAEAAAAEGLVVLRPKFGIEGMCVELIAWRRSVSARRTRVLTRLPRRCARPGWRARRGRRARRAWCRFDDEPIAVLLVSAADASHSVARRILGRVLDLPETDRTLTSTRCGSGSPKPVRRPPRRAGCTSTDTLSATGCGGSKRADRPQPRRSTRRRRTARPARIARMLGLG